MNAPRFKKPTRAELEDRYIRTAALLAQGNTKGAVKSALIKAYDISARTCETYLARARELLLAETGKPAGEHRAESLAFYQTIKADPNASTIAKLKAQERIDKLLALELPAKLTLTDSTGENPMTIRLEAQTLESLPDEELGKLAAAYDVMERLKAGSQN